jgi:hypothetical protein
MKKYIVLFILFIFGISNLHSEFKDLSFKFSYGWGSYLMNLPKNLSSDIVQATPFSDKIISNYPDYFNYKIEFGFPLTQKTKLALNYTRLSTGAYISYKDYSGEYRYESFLTGDAIGVNLQFNLNKSDSIYSILLNFETGYLSTQFSSNEKIYIAGSSLINPFDLSESSNYFYPSLAFSYRLAYGDIGLNLGYFFDLQKTFGDDNENATDWSGLRIYLNYSVQPFKLFK